VTDVTTLLAGIKTRALAYRTHGTPGLHAPQDRAKLLAALEAVTAIHKPSTVRRTKYNGEGTLISYTLTEDGPCHACYPPAVASTALHCEDCGEGSYGLCDGVQTVISRPWPCPTITAITTALGSGE
jgi:hypothetical protein